MIALEKKLGRLEKIKQMAQKIDGNLDYSITFIFNDTKAICNNCNLLRKVYALMKYRRKQQLKDNQSGEKAQKDWFQRHFPRVHLQDEEFITNSQFEMWWISLDCPHFAWKGLSETNILEKLLTKIKEGVRWARKLEWEMAALRGLMI